MKFKMIHENYNVIQALKWHELKKQEGKEIAG